MGFLRRGYGRCLFGTRLTFINYSGMPDDAARFREHAANCRLLARQARDEASRRMLIEIADDLDAEVRDIETKEEAATKRKAD